MARVFKRSDPQSTGFLAKRRAARAPKPTTPKLRLKDRVSLPTPPLGPQLPVAKQPFTGIPSIGKPTGKRGKRSGKK